MNCDPLWETIFSTRAWGRYPSEDLIRFCAQRFYGLQPRSDVRLLEVGFGTGANLWYFAREGFSVHGLEGSEAGAAQAAQRLDMEVPGWRDRPAALGSQRLLARDMCEPLPWADGQFDAVVDCDAATCVDHDSACRVYTEMARVTKPGGRLVVCEFSRPTNAAFRAAYQQGALKVLPAVADRVATNPDAYRYLAESITAWPGQPELAQIIRRAGWSSVAWTDLTGGIVALHSAARPLG